MSDLRISDIAEMTGFSMRYWQRRASKGEIPQTRVVHLGERKATICKSAYPGSIPGVASITYLSDQRLGRNADAQFASCAPFALGQFLGHRS